MATTMCGLTRTATSRELASPNMSLMLAQSTLPLSFPRRAPYTANSPLSLGFMTSPSVTPQPLPHAPPMSNSSHNNHSNNSKLPPSTPRSQSMQALPTSPPPTVAPLQATSNPPPSKRLTDTSIQIRPAKYLAPPVSHTHPRRCRHSSQTMGGPRSNACRLMCEGSLKAPLRVWHDQCHKDILLNWLQEGLRKL